MRTVLFLSALCVGASLAQTPPKTYIQNTIKTSVSLYNQKFYDWFRINLNMIEFYNDETEAFVEQLLAGTYMQTPWESTLEYAFYTKFDTLTAQTKAEVATLAPALFNTTEFTTYFNGQKISDKAQITIDVEVTNIFSVFLDVSQIEIYDTLSKALQTELVWAVKNKSKFSDKKWKKYMKKLLKKCGLSSSYFEIDVIVTAAPSDAVAFLEIITELEIEIMAGAVSGTPVFNDITIIIDTLRLKWKGMSREARKWCRKYLKEFVEKVKHRCPDLYEDFYYCSKGSKEKNSKSSASCEYMGGDETTPDQVKETTAALEETTVSSVEVTTEEYLLDDGTLDINKPGTIGYVLYRTFLTSRFHWGKWSKSFKHIKKLMKKLSSELTVIIDQLSGPFDNEIWEQSELCAFLELFGSLEYSVRIKIMGEFSFFWDIEEFRSQLVIASKENYKVVYTEIPTFYFTFLSEDKIEFFNTLTDEEKMEIFIAIKMRKSFSSDELYFAYLTSVCSEFTADFFFGIKDEDSKEVIDGEAKQFYELYIQEMEFLSYEVCFSGSFDFSVLASFKTEMQSFWMSMSYEAKLTCQSHFKAFFLLIEQYEIGFLELVEEATTDSA